MKTAGKILRWVSRIAGLLLVALVLFIFVGESLSGDAPVWQALSLSEKLGFVWLALMVGGLLLEWKSTLLGSSITILGYVAFSVMEGSPLGSLFALFPALATAALVGMVLVERATPG